MLHADSRSEAFHLQAALAPPESSRGWRRHYLVVRPSPSLTRVSHCNLRGEESLTHLELGMQERRLGGIGQDRRRRLKAEAGVDAHIFPREHRELCSYVVAVLSCWAFIKTPKTHRSNKGPCRSALGVRFRADQGPERNGRHDSAGRRLARLQRQQRHLPPGASGRRGRPQEDGPLLEGQGKGNRLIEDDEGHQDGRRGRSSRFLENADGYEPRNGDGGSGLFDTAARLPSPPDAVQSPLRSILVDVCALQPTAAPAMTPFSVCIGIHVRL